ncbi:MAG: b-lactamase [Parcubacteria bacterium C7867-003]|nr:MAG: b-lactamase [Parcubacteria bacterium C7867-003]
MQGLFKNKFTLFATVASVLFIGFFLGRIGHHDTVGRSHCVSKLTLLKPNIDCDSFEDTINKLSKLQTKLDVMIQGLKKTGRVKRASVFVRDLNTSRFAGVNDADTYYMASLLKTPLLVGGFKLAEVEPRILDQTVTYNGVPNLYGEQVIKSEKILVAGESYTIKELMTRAIVYSDNTASQILFDYYPQDFLDRILQALGIQHTRPDKEVENFVTARSYANIFRILYNASYLTREYSNEALKILTESTYKDGATSKLPKDVVVAHKFAERTLVYESGAVAVRQFHECGIVYAKKGEDPYIFCIMTEGSEYEILEEVIADISLAIYEEITNE